MFESRGQSEKFWVLYILRNYSWQVKYPHWNLDLVVMMITLIMKHRKQLMQPQSSPFTPRPNQIYPNLPITLSMMHIKQLTQLQSLLFTPHPNQIYRNLPPLWTQHWLFFSPLDPRNEMVHESTIVIIKTKNIVNVRKDMVWLVITRVDLFHHFIINCCVYLSSFLCFSHAPTCKWVEANVANNSQTTDFSHHVRHVNVMDWWYWSSFSELTERKLAILMYCAMILYGLGTLLVDLVALPHRIVLLVETTLCHFESWLSRFMIYFCTIERLNLFGMIVHSIIRFELSPIQLWGWIVWNTINETIFSAIHALSGESNILSCPNQKIPQI